MHATSKMTSAYLDSDSGSDLSLASDSSDINLPAYDLCSPPKIPRISAPQEESASLCRNPLARPPVSPVTSTFPAPHGGVSELPQTPPSCVRAVLLSPSTVSPSPCKLVVKHEKDLNLQTKLTRKVEKLTANLKIKAEKTTKLEQYRNCGGIRGLAKQLENNPVSSAGRVESCSTDQPLSPTLNKSNKFPFPLSAPGYPILTSAPCLITELYPPGYHDVETDGTCNGLEKSMMQQQNPEVLSQLICERWFLLCYRTSPCPLLIWQWLFQIMCLSCNEHLAEKAYFNLQTLVEWTSDKTLVYVPMTTTVLDILVNLGADKSQLDKGRSQESMAKKSDCDDSFLHLTNLSNLFRYLSCAVTANPTALSADDLYQIICITVIVSLDCSVTKSPPVLSVISECLSSLVTAIPTASWPTSLCLLPSCLAQLSTHHHDLLHLSRLFVTPVVSTGTIPRVTELQVAVCKVSMWKLLFPGNMSAELTDHEVAWGVVKHYCDTPISHFRYYDMYSIICMLSKFMNLSRLDWPSADKINFKNMLSRLANVKIRDIAESAERAPVKDLLITMALELDFQRGRDTVQTDLYEMISNT